MTVHDLNARREDPAHQHNTFQPDMQVQVFRDQQDRTGEDIGFMASIAMSCGECGIDFWWPGLMRGQSFNGPRTTPDTLRLLAPFRPQSKEEMAVDSIPDIDGDADTATQRREAIGRALQHPAQFALRASMEDALTWRTRAITNALDAL